MGWCTPIIAPLFCEEKSGNGEGVRGQCELRSQLKASMDDIVKPSQTTKRKKKRKKKNLKTVFKERTIQVSPTKKMAKNKAKFQGRPDLPVPFLWAS